MDSFKLNKFAMAFLGTVFVLMSADFISASLFESHAPEKAGYLIEADENAGQVKDTKKAGLSYDPIASLLANADLDAGVKVAKKCISCHTFEKGGKKKVGPNLYNIVNGTIAGIDGFAYSSALKSFASDKSWDYATLNGFLYKPKKYIKGTAMGFAGLKKTQDRANVIAYLRSLSDAPVPLPVETPVASD